MSEQKEKKVDIFTFINNISARNSPNLIDEDSSLEKEFNPFITNRSFSNFRDTILIANEMNQRHHIPKKLQYDFYKYIVRPSKRWAKWPKKDKDKLVLLELICDYFDCGMKTAQDYLTILKDSDIEKIKKEMDRGGVEHGTRIGRRSS
jgi:methyltransferase-like protein